MMNTDRDKQNEAIQRYQTAIERYCANSDAIGRCSRIEDPEARKIEYIRLKEREKQLEDEELFSKGEYERLNCQEITNLSSDAFERNVIWSYERAKELERQNERSTSITNSL